VGKNGLEAARLGRRPIGCYGPAPCNVIALEMG
jgi:hypothetical protein